MGIQNNNESTTAHSFKLSQNYPNPFNPSTVIKYSVPKSSMIKLIVYDVLGHEVNILVNGFKQAGNYEIKFDASNLTSGIYFYKPETGNFSDVKKMLIVK